MLWILSNVCIYIFEMLIAYNYFYRNYSKKINSDLKIFAIGGVLFFIAAVIFLSFGKEVINLSVFFIINTLFAYVCFDISIKSAIIQGALLDVLMSCSELVAIFSISTLMGIPINTYKNDILIYVILASICKALYFLISQIVSLVVKKDKIDELKIKHVLPLIVFLSLAIATCTLFLLIALKVDLSYSYKIAIFIISIVFIFACAWIFIYYQTFIGNERKINELRIENEKQEINSKYLKIIEQNNKNLSILAHDIKNHMIQIKSMENSEDIHNYVDSIVDEVQGYSYIGMSKNKTLDLLISKYLNLCGGKGIKISFDVKTANLSGIAPVDISTIINNLLDNAVESAEKSEKKEIFVTIFKKQGYEILNINNSCDDKPKVKGDKLLTTKKESSLHGYGTQSVIKTLKKYEGVYSWEYHEKEKIFESNVLLPIE